MRHAKGAPSRREALGLLGASAIAVAGAARTAEPEFPPGAIIRTLTKDYAPAELAGAATLFHEHMSLRDGFMTDWMRHAAETRAATQPPGAPPRPARPPGAPATPAGNFLADEDLMADELAIAKREGIGCIVDAGHPDMGRDVGFLRRISQRSGLPIVASAGFYTQPFYPPELATWSEDKVAEEIMQQVRANPTGALGEIGSWDYISKDERKVFRAVGKVHRATNLPIFTHTGIPGKSALEQLDILEDAGVDPRRVVIGHLGNLVDPNTEVQRAIIRRGAFVGIDRQGGAGDAQVVPMVVSLIADGYADHLMFSSDLSMPREIKRNNPAGGYAKTLTVFVPKLRAAGVPEAALHRIMYDNPRRFLAFVPKIRRTA
ncbi:MAG TPA: amidohydrolase family protein [Phenylobacterium sp.]|jgi:phosphotriesterase-related protein|nr:amidohydrolase family protein [Phenylobacterium sp.]